MKKIRVCGRNQCASVHRAGRLCSWTASRLHRRKVRPVWADVLKRNQFLGVVARLFRPKASSVCFFISLFNLEFYMSIATMKQSISKRQQRGQGMTEYIIIVALIAIAGIVVFAAFGDVVKNQTASMARELSGESGAAATTQAGTRSTAAENAAKQKGTLKSFSGNQ